MKQLYYTSCQAKKSLNGLGGYQVRAASSGVPQEYLRDVPAWANYTLPKGYTEDTPPSDAPTRLALFHLSGGERLLCYTTYVGIDPDTHRYGNFFSHLLFDIPDSHEAPWALEAWGSQFWHTKDDNSGTALSDIHPHNIAGGVPHPTKIAGYVRAHRELARFLLRALLAERRRVFVVAPAEAVAQALYAVVHILLADTTAGLTFSTYEFDPISCPAWVVGTCWKDTQTHRDLDSQCYEGTGYGFNTFTGRQSNDLPPEPAFVEFALHALENDRGDEVTHFLHECRHVEVSDTRGLDLAYRVFHGATLEAADLVIAADYPGLLTRVAAQPGMIECITECGLSTPDTRRDLLPKFARGLGDAGTARLADAIWQWGLTALQRGEAQAARTIWEEGLQAVDPQRATTLGAGVRNALNPQTLSSDMRLALLPLVLQNAPTGTAGEQALRGWLSFPSAQLAVALQVMSSREVQRWALRTSLSEMTPATVSPEVRRVVSAAPSLLLELMADLYPCDPGQALEWFDTLSADASSRELTDELFRIGPGAPPLFAACLQQMARAGRLDLTTALRDRTDVRLTDLPPDAIAALVDQLLSASSTVLAPPPDVTNFLKCVRNSPTGQRLNKETRRRLESWLQFMDFCAAPVLDEASLRLVGEFLSSLETAKRVAVGHEITKLVANTLLRTPQARDAKDALERVLKHLAQPIANSGWVDHFRQLLSCCEQDKRFWKAVPTLYAFLSIGFSETHQQYLLREGKNNLIQASLLACSVLKKLRRKNAKAIDAIRSIAIHEWQVPSNIARITPCALPDGQRSVAARLIRWIKMISLGLALALVFMIFWKRQEVFMIFGKWWKGFMIFGKWWNR